MRLHVSGCKARASHTHFDKGAFTLELDEEPVLIDRGVVRYDDIRHLLMKRTDLHNVLTPVRADGTFPGQVLAETAVIPDGRGTSARFKPTLISRRPGPA